MFPLLNPVLKQLMRLRLQHLQRFKKQPHLVQEQWFKYLIKRGQNTWWGNQHQFGRIKTKADFDACVPVSAYEDIAPLIEQQMRGQANVLWPGRVTWFAKSSGTTNARSKFIPVTRESLHYCHYRAGKDLLAIYTGLYPNHRLFTGKGLSLGGSHQPNPLQNGSRYGDVSAVIMQNLPVWAQAIRAPSLDIALLETWEEKIARIIETTRHQNITSIAGVPTWTYVLINKMLEATGKSSLLDIWPNLELFAHGAVAFGPYRQLFKQLLPKPGMHYLELYNASEGFFGIQDQHESEDLLLLLDHGIYYEFLPLDQEDQPHPQTLSLAEVEVGKSYALVISTNAGLWRYKIGDTIKFTSLAPYRIRITGRTKHFINAFGEELVIENAESAITEACRQTNAHCTDFTAAPVYFEGGKQGGHEWYIEFEKAPDNLSQFTQLLDNALRKLNSDYDAKRQQDLALAMPLVRQVPQGTFYQWMQSRGKAGGQHKVPRLSNHREIVEDLQKFMKKLI